MANQVKSDEDISVDLGIENTLWKIAKSSISIKPSGANGISAVISFFGVFIISFIFCPDKIVLLSLVRDLARIGFNASIALLGFFITGFSIFATLGDRALFVEMAKTTEDSTGLSYFKYNFFTMLRTFLITFVIIVIDLCMIIILGPGIGLGKVIISMFGQKGIDVVVCLTLSVIFCSIVVIALVAKTFVANIYEAVTTSVRWTIFKK